MTKYPKSLSRNAAFARLARTGWRMITFFSVPKPFVGHIGVIQRNALRSWKQAVPGCEIILFGDEEGIGEAAADIGAAHVSLIRKNEYGTPYLDGIFRQANDMAKYDILCFSNCDMIYTEALLRTVREVGRHKFLMVGRRFDVALEDEFAPERFTEVLTDIRARAHRSAAWAVDYFIFPKGVFRDIPPFLIGRAGWDNWMLFNARFQRVPLVDCTASIEAFHQNHDYAHVKKSTGRFYGPESDYNLRLLKCQFFSLKDADHRMGAKGLELAHQPLYRRLWYKLLLRPELWEAVGPLMKYLSYAKIKCDTLVMRMAAEDRDRRNGS